MSSPARDRPLEARLDALRDELIDRGLAPRHADRLVAELHDHAASIREDVADATGCGRDETAHVVERRLGPLERIAERALADRRRIALGRRHPALLFVVAPPLALFASVVALTVLLTLPMALARAFGVDLTGAWMAALPPFYAALMPLLAAAFTVFLTGYALTRHCRMRWPIASMVLLAALCAVLRVDLVPPSGAAPGQFTIAALLPLHHWLWAIPPAVFVVTLLSRRRSTVRSA